MKNLSKSHTLPIEEIKEILLSTIEKLTSRIYSLEESIKAGPKEFYTLGEAVAYLQVSKSQMYMLTFNRAIPYYKPSGRKVYFKKEDLDAFIFANRISSKSEILKRK